MPRIRTLKPEHRQHRKVGKLSHIAYRLWIGMILEADDEGRLVCEAEHLRVLIFGYHPKVSGQTVEAAIQELAEVGLIRTYAYGGNRYTYLPSWKDHQRIDHPTKSVLPEPNVVEPYKNIRIPDAVRREVAFRYGAVEGVPLYVQCHYCRTAEGGIHVFSRTGWVAFAELELVPEYLGGPSTAANLVLACRKCNINNDSRILASDPGSFAIIPGGSERNGSEGKGSEVEWNRHMVAPSALGRVSASDGFEEFWQTYPAHRHVKKALTLTAWRSLNPNPVLRQTILAALVAQKQSPDWQRERGRYVPHPERWIKNRRWEDAVADSQASLLTEKTAGNLDAGRRFVERVKTQEAK